MKNRIWIFCHYAQQPPYNTMLRYHNWGKELLKRGYQVTIVAASTVHNTDIDVMDVLNSERTTCDNVNYVYLKTPTYSGNGFSRMKNMLSYGMQLKKMKKENEKPDIIIVCEAYLYLFAKFFFRKTPIITDIVDLWPESIVEYAGTSRYHPLVQMLYLVEKEVYLKTDALVFSIEGGEKYLKEQKYSAKIDYSKVFHINMGIDIKETDKNKILGKQELPWDMSKVNIVYCGSIRKANNVQQICDAALEIYNRGVTDVVFQIYGNGNELDYLKEYVSVKQIPNVHFYGRIEKEKIPYILSCASANILTYKQVELMKYGVIQSKLFDYLASGRPIICNAKFGYSLIDRYNCGFVTTTQTAEAFADTVQELCLLSNGERDEMGKRARKAAEDYDQPHLVDILCNVFKYVGMNFGCEENK